MSFAMSHRTLLASPIRGTRHAFRQSKRLQSNIASEGAMSWSEFFDVRRGKRRWEMSASIPSALIALWAGGSYLGNIETDPTKPIFGIDPLYIMGAGTLACGGLGYLIGPIIGGGAWRLLHRQKLPALEAREREFFTHIKRNRVDPRVQSAANPIPDFYGEKIGSLHQYRQWLRDQSRYRKKRTWISE